MELIQLGSEASIYFCELFNTWRFQSLYKIPLSLVLRAHSLRDHIFICSSLVFFYFIFLWSVPFSRLLSYPPFYFDIFHIPYLQYIFNFFLLFEIFISLLLPKRFILEACKSEWDNYIKMLNSRYCREYQYK